MAYCQAFQKCARLACLKLRPTCSTLCLPSITKLLCYFTIIPVIIFFCYSILEKYFDKLSLTTEPPYHQYTTEPDDLFGGVNPTTPMLSEHTYSQLLDLNSRWKPSLPSNLTVVSIIKNNDNVELQLNSIFSQTIMPQGMIIIASKNTAKKVKHVIKENDKYSGFDVWIHVMETNKFKIIGWLEVAQAVKTSHILFLDSGVVLGKKFIQNMVHTANTKEYHNAILGTTGAYIEVDDRSDNKQSLVCFADHESWPDDLELINLSQKVDMLTNIWLFKKQWIHILFQENNMESVKIPFGFFFSFSLKYHANIPSYILPTNHHDEDSWGDRNLIQQKKCKDLKSNFDTDESWNYYIERGYPLVFKEKLLINSQLNKILFVVDSYDQGKTFRPLFCKLSMIKDNLVNVLFADFSQESSNSNMKGFIEYSSDCNVEIYDLSIQAEFQNSFPTQDEINLKSRMLYGVNRMLHYFKPEVVIYPKIEDSDAIHGITIAADGFKNITTIQLPLDEIVHAVDIMADLSFEALKSQLLESLNSSIYFGDEIPLTINMDKGASPHIVKLADKFNWDHGSKNIRRRVGQGGLLPAVVEAYYPYNDHDYAVLLEDDTELSPFYYIWSKYIVLKYKYGPDKIHSKRMYGISLYSPKHMELTLPGRKKFYPEQVFNNTKYDVRLPYLCQAPSDWGGVYFPEIWHEFHRYLIDRLEDDNNNFKVQPISIPHSRSNNWKNSWKQFFIELVYLRGYVMLYPNFSNFTSFSTNLAEYDDTHIRFREGKHDPLSIFGVPLMTENVIFKELPGEALANYNDLPVLDLWGNLTTFHRIILRGHEFQSKISDCPPIDTPDPPYDPYDLLCVDPSEKDIAESKSRKFQRDIKAMMKMFTEDRNMKNAVEIKMGPRKYIDIFMNIMNSTREARDQLQKQLQLPLHQEQEQDQPMHQDPNQDQLIHQDQEQDLQIHQDQLRQEQEQDIRIH
nr:12623_t:CDS:2 [Entrophospora candida]